MRLPKGERIAQPDLAVFALYRNVMDV